MPAKTFTAADGRKITVHHQPDWTGDARIFTEHPGGEAETSVIPCEVLLQLGRRAALAHLSTALMDRIEALRAEEIG